ncbi:MAG: hypothetical protein J5548_02250, partial [Prevotella sp.]|nr:hypothetical protein [Prevotella sp.]
MNKWIRSFILLLFALSTQWVQAQSVAKIGDTEYATLADAIAAVPTNGTETTITMIADETVESASGAALTIAANKNVVLDLNGKVISLSSHIANSGTLTIQDGNGNGKIASNAGYTIVNTNGTLTIKSGTYTNTATDLILQRGGNITINGGSFTSESTVINVQSIGEGHTLTITNGKFTAEKNDAIYVAASAPTVSISGGEFITKSYVANGNPAAATAFHVVSNCTGGTIAISGGTFRALSTVNGSRALNVGSNPGISVTGGDFYSNAKDGRSVSSRTDGILAGGTYDGMVYSNYVANGKFAYPNDAHSRYTIEDFDETRVNDLAVAKIGDTYYTSLEEVSSEITAGCTVTLLKDLNYSEKYTFYLLDNMTLDGNGHTLTGNIQIDCNNGSGVAHTGVTIKDTKFVDITAVDGYVIRASKQSGNFTVTGCTFDNTKGQAIQCTTVAGANVTITGNTFKNGTGSKRYINLYGTGTNDASEIDVVISGNIFYEETNTQNLRLNAFGANNNFDINGNYFEDPQHSLIEKFNSSKDSFEFTVCGLDETGNIDTASEQIYVATGATSEATIAPVTMVAQIGTQKYRTIDAAVEAANEGETIEVIADGDYKLPNLPKNVTIEGKADGEVSFTHTTAGSIASVPNGATFKNVTFNLDNVNYHGFQHAGTINMEGCTLDGKFFSYGDMNFTDCSFNQTNSDYHMWAYSGNLTYTDCTFTNSSTGKFINVYNESGATKYTVTANNCTFINNGSSNKAALNIKATCGSTLLAYDVIINNCSTEGSFPEASSSDALVVLNSIAQVDDRTASGVDNITVTQDGVLIYPATVAAIGENRYPTLQSALDAAHEMTGDVTITLLDDISGYSIAHQKEGVNVTIDGDNKTVNGQIIIDGDGRASGTETLTIQNVKFEGNTTDFLSGTDAFILIPSTKDTGKPYTTGKYNYAHNITVKDCSFTSTSSNDPEYDVVGI